MNKKERMRKRRITVSEYIFIWGIIFAPMQALRVFKFGPGEILLILWMMTVFFKKGHSSHGIVFNAINKYQLANLLMMILGMLVDIIIYGTRTRMSALVTDYLSHLFMFLLSISILNMFLDTEIDDINHVLSKIVVWGACVYGAMLLYGMYISGSLFGIRLWMSGNTRFIGLTTNPHQLGMITGTGLFFSLYLMSTEISIIKKCFFLIIAGIWFWVSSSLKSDTMTVSYVICLASFLFLKTSKIEKNPLARRRNFVILTFFLIIEGLALSGKLVGILSDFISEAGNGEDRLVIWQTGFGQLLEKPLGFITGLGPGSHTGRYMLSGNEIEAHNTYVQLVLDAGVFICIYYIITLFRIIKHPFAKNTYLILSVLYFALYGFGGNMNRRVLVWFTYTMVGIIFNKTEGTKISQV